ncbi:MAG: hypothetical protein WAL38_12870, partial [Solirubrobacteraceae bacterium]
MPRPLLPIADARDLVLSACRPLGSESVPIAAARDRVLAVALEAAGDVPPFPCSAMDGYALMPGPAGRTLTIVAESRAGLPTTHTLNDHEAIRISTGGAIPAGATAVIPQENVDAQDGTITTRTATNLGDHIRGRGEDMRAGSTVLKAGTVLGAAELGAAVSAGVAELTVARRPKVQVLSTG